MAMQIPLTKGFVATVDEADYEYLMQWKWSAHVGPGGRVAAYRKVGQGKGQLTKNEWMHRAILAVPEELEVDHINGDALDNRRANLRLATREQNLRSRSTFKNNKSGYKGVVFDNKSKRWRAYLNIGPFDTPEEAARAYDDAVIKLFDQFAKPNFDNES